MKNTFKLLLAFVLVIGLVQPAMAQNRVTRTTLSSALSAGTQNTLVVVSSATGITASTSNSCSNYILVDRELMCIRAISGTTLTVARAQVSTAAAAHASGATVIFGTGGGTFNPNTGNTSGVFLGGNSLQPTGACTRTSQEYLPVFSLPNTINNGFTYDCLGGKWVQGTMPDQPDATPLTAACTVPLGSVAYSSFGSNTTSVAGREWMASITIPKTAWITSVKFLCGGNCVTDKIYGIVRDSGGNLLANTDAGGVTLSGVDTLQSINLNTSMFLVGPARYFLSVVGNGTTTGFLRAIAASTFPDVFTAINTGGTGTFGTITTTFNGTVPTTFSANIGPIGCIQNQ